MIQAMRSRHRALGRQLLALWCVLLIACAFTHIELASADAAEVAVVANHTSHDHGQGTPDSCCAVQNVPLNQQLLALLALPALLSLFGDLQRRIGRLAAVPLLASGLSPPIRKRLHRYNE